jgi:hypothetical protein
VGLEANESQRSIVVVRHGITEELECERGLPCISNLVEGPLYKSCVPNRIGSSATFLSALHLQLTSG